MDYEAFIDTCFHVFLCDLAADAKKKCFSLNRSMN